MERKQGIQTAKDNFPFGCGDRSVLGCPDTAKYVDGDGSRLDIDIDEFLKALHVCSFGPVDHE